MLFLLLEARFGFIYNAYLAETRDCFVLEGFILLLSPIFLFGDLFFSPFFIIYL